MRIALAAVVLLFAVNANAESGDTQITVDYKVRVPKEARTKVIDREFKAVLHPDGTVEDFHSKRDTVRDDELGDSRWTVVDASTLKRTVNKENSTRTFVIKVDGKTCKADFTLEGANPRGLQFDVVSCRIE